MNRLFTLLLLGLAGLLASCGTSVSSSTQAATNDIYTLDVSPTQFTLNAGDWSSITATVDLSNKNSAPKPVKPQPTIKFSSSDPRVSVSPAGEVCAGLWDTKYLTCTPTVIPPNDSHGNPKYVTITAYNASRNVSGSAIVSVHERAASIALKAPTWGSRTCISQTPSTPPIGTPAGTPPVNDNQVQYVANASSASGSDISKEIFANDYTWIVADPNVASVSSYGFVTARNPGVTNVYAKLNGTTSAPLAFVTCPPSTIVLASSRFTNGTPVAPFSTDDLNLKKGDREYFTATLKDINNHLLIASPLNYTTSDPLTGNFSAALPLTSTLTTNTAGRFSVLAACEPPTCNASVGDFIVPNATVPTTGASLGFGFPIYSNVIGVTVSGINGSTVLVSGATLTDGTPSHRLLAYDSESLTLTHVVGLANVPNSLVLAPNGAKAYLGSSDGLIVVDLTSYQQSIQNFPVAGGISTDVVTGTVLGVSPDSRYVLVSDTSKLDPTRHLVFLIDTTGTKVAARYAIPGIRAVTFAADNSNFWIGGDSGVYVFKSDTFVPTATNGCAPSMTSACTQIKALAWMPDGQSFFASGQLANTTTSQLINYSTCDDVIHPPPQSSPQSLPGSPTSNLATTVLGSVASGGPTGVPLVIGLAGTEWFDNSVTTTAQIPVGQTSSPGPGNVCQSKVTVNPLVHQPSGLTCPAQQISFSPVLQQAFVTGVDSSCVPQPFIDGYDLNAQKVLTPVPTAAPVIPLSGGVLNDGRKLYFGTHDSTGATLHRINFDLTAGPLGEDASTAVDLVPSFVAVVPK